MAHLRAYPLSKETAPDGSPFAASGFIVNCPIISSD